MRTLNIAISDLEYDRYGLTSENLSFSEFLELITRELMRQNLNKSLELAEEYGLSEMSMEEIDQEVKAVRSHAKSDN